MGIEIDGVLYLTTTEVLAEASVSRQTLWRWRQDGKIPVGRRYRDKQVVFTETEVDAIREYAQRIEPIDETGARQFRLFNGNG